MTKVLQVLIIMILAVFLVGCGGGSSEPPNEQAAAVSEQGKTQSPEQAEPETTELESEASDEVPLVAGFPKEVPLIEGSIIQSDKTDTVSLKDGSKTGEAYVTIIATPKSVTEAAEFYKSKFSQIDDQMDGDSPYFSGVIANYDVTVYIGTTDGKTEVQVQVNLPQ